MSNQQIIEGIEKNAKKVFKNLGMNELVQIALDRGEGKLTSTGALAADTGEFTGRSPKNKFTVKDDLTADSVWWGDINQPFDPNHFDLLLNKVVNHYNGKEIFVRKAYAVANPKYRLNIDVVTESAYQNLFARHMFLRPKQSELDDQAEWIILAAPSFMAVAAEDNTRQHNFTIVNMTKKIIIIGGSGYTGEIKKGIFGVLNYILPHNKKVLSMHCSANIGKDGDTSLFFGLSGTGKTTLSADPNRELIGDDEHGWDGDTVFNFEGGCYAKCIDLTAENEPEIWAAIKDGSLVENVRFFPDSNVVNYEDISVTPNTRVAYPINYIENAANPSMGSAPKNIFFLTADAFGVLPPISRLTKEQAMYHFISGYTAKVAGTEEGVVDPEATFSACFGGAFLPLHPGEYAKLLGEKLDADPNVKVWLINTGWTGGPFGVGERMKLKYTRAMIGAAMRGELNDLEYTKHKVFGIQMPVSCPNVPTEVLNPRGTWANKDAYDEKALHLAGLFNNNFKQFESGVSKEILAAAPNMSASV